MDQHYQFEMDTSFKRIEYYWKLYELSSPLDDVTFFLKNIEKELKVIEGRLQNYQWLLNARALKEEKQVEQSLEALKDRMICYVVDIIVSQNKGAIYKESQQLWCDEEVNYSDRKVNLEE